MNNSSTAKQRRSLKGALRHILLKCRRQSSDNISDTVGSGILRREPSLPIFQNESTTAFLFGLDSVGNDDERDNDDIPDRFDISSLATSAAMSSTRTLMPKMSLSDFNFYHPPIQETKYLRRGRLDSVSSSLVGGASYHASVISLNSTSSLSTLRIQKSSNTLISESEQTTPPLIFPERINCEALSYSTPDLTFACPSPPRSNHTFASVLSSTSSPARSLKPQRSLVRKRSSIGDLASPIPSRPFPTSFDFEPSDTPATYFSPYYNFNNRRFPRALSVIEEDDYSVNESPTRSPRTPNPFVQSPSVSRTSSVRSEFANPLLSVKHFSSFCALDTVAPGCPVTATSTDLRYIFEIGEQFCLNNQACEGVSMDMITGSDAVGNPVTHLVLFSPLIIPSSGRSRFMLASLVDVTDFIHDTASLPELELISEESSEADPPTPRSKLQPRTPKYQLSAESLLSGCFVDEPKTPVQQRDEDVWLNLATEEKKNYPRCKTSSGIRTPASATSAASSIDDVLDDFMYRLQELHSDFFLLAKSPLDDNYYEICNVSPRVYAQRDYVNGHLSKTPAADMARLSAQLAGGDAFDMQVRWGHQGVPKRLYSIPLFARSAITWICFLVDPSLPILW